MRNRDMLATEELSYPNSPDQVLETPEGQLWAFAPQAQQTWLDYEARAVAKQNLQIQVQAAVISGLDGGLCRSDIAEMLRQVEEKLIRKVVNPMLWRAERSSDSSSEEYR